ncbi:hypothetical protein [Deinococcus wulumuqiensis]|uniref:hypothetical protein n=1 Tax=Deinococcus wulumuqiensis TaxID=980427 RepID=UPI0013C37A16|nr:hypothetical protein [Deinococcus wulumuqiensis]
METAPRVNEGSRRDALYQALRERGKAKKAPAGPGTFWVPVGAISGAVIVFFASKNPVLAYLSEIIIFILGAWLTPALRQDLSFSAPSKGASRIRGEVSGVTSEDCDEVIRRLELEGPTPLEHVTTWFSSQSPFTAFILLVVSIMGVERIPALVGTLTGLEIDDDGLSLGPWATPLFFFSVALIAAHFMTRFLERVRKHEIVVLHEVKAQITEEKSRNSAYPGKTRTPTQSSPEVVATEQDS